MQRTTINRGWLVKMIVFIVVLGGLGLWGLYDATVAYPARGRAHAEWEEKEYLEKAFEAGELSPGVPDPKAELARLRAEKASIEAALLQAETSGLTRQKNQQQMLVQRLEWLTALSRVGDLDPAHTAYANTNPRERLNELQTKWATQNQPKPLQTYDIPLQWVIFAAGAGGALYILLLIGMVSRRVYQYEPETMTLTLPCGKKITPSDIKEVDKRKWDKFFVFLHLKEGGSPRRLDLLRAKGLEGWILEMEKKTEGYEPPPAAPEEPAEAGAGAAAGAAEREA